MMTVKIKYEQEKENHNNYTMYIDFNPQDLIFRYV